MSLQFVFSIVGFLDSSVETVVDAVELAPHFVGARTKHAIDLKRVKG